MAPMRRRQRCARNWHARARVSSSCAERPTLPRRPRPNSWSRLRSDSSGSSRCLGSSRRRVQRWIGSARRRRRGRRSWAPCDGRPKRSALGCTRRPRRRSRRLASLRKPAAQCRPRRCGMRRLAPSSAGPRRKWPPSRGGMTLRPRRVRVCRGSSGSSRRRRRVRQRLRRPSSVMLWRDARGRTQAPSKPHRPHRPHRSRRNRAWEGCKVR
mmetsp:Transcript_10580/g.26381  ORF Transcript_10580/g.26381 Transcript_10580/m.26381 type:complete len:211 (+) Transcript_10580:419-1051(+)